MKDELKCYIYDNPNTWARYLKNRPYLMKFIESSSGNSIAEKAFVSVHGATEHKCVNCKAPTLFENFMKGYRSYCSTECNQRHKSSLADIDLTQRILALPNFKLLSGIEKTGKFGRKIFTVKNLNCGHSFKVNNLNLFTNPDNYCAICGPVNRQKKMTAVNVSRKKILREEVLKTQQLTFDKYSKTVRALTRKVVAANNEKINPNNLKISRYDNHIDHIVSIYTGWQNNIDPRLISCLDNLAIIPALDNLKKSHATNKTSLELYVHCDKWLKSELIVGSNLVMDEIQISPLVISFNSMSVGIALPCRNAEESTEQYSISEQFTRYIFIGELDSQVIKKRLAYWGKSGINKIRASKCEVVELKAFECRKFLDNNHSQGFLAAKIYLGLKSDNRLVSVMTFGKPRFDKKHDWELIRFSSSENVVGAASKLIKYFKQHNEGSIISYSNRSYGTGNIYSILGFTFTHKTPPSKWFYSTNDPTNIMKTSSFIFAKKDDFDFIELKYVPFLNKGNDVFVL